MSDFYRELREGKRSQGSQKKRYKDTLITSLKDFEISMGFLEQIAQERSQWQGLINKGAALCKKRESVKLKESAENAEPIPMDRQLII